MVEDRFLGSIFTDLDMSETFCCEIVTPTNASIVIIINRNMSIEKDGGKTEFSYGM